MRLEIQGAIGGMVICVFMFGLIFAMAALAGAGRGTILPVMVSLIPTFVGLLIVSFFMHVGLAWLVRQ